MTTECTTERLEFGGLRRQRVGGRFDGGELGSDGGGLLLRELAQRTGLFGRLSACFRDYREPQRTRHPVKVQVAARVRRRPRHQRGTHGRATREHSRRSTTCKERMPS